MSTYALAAASIILAVCMIAVVSAGARSQAMFQRLIAALRLELDAKNNLITALRSQIVSEEKLIAALNRQVAAQDSLINTLKERP